MSVDTPTTISRTSKEAEVAGILKQMATVLRNMRTYEPNNPVLHKSFDVLFNRLVAFLDKNASLTLLIRETDLIFGNTAVYSSDDKMESLAFALYRDGIRLLSLRDGLCIAPGELYDFMRAMHEAREADPYQADLVTILWEKDLANINYRAVDSYLEDEEKRSIEEIAQKCETAPTRDIEGEMLPSTEFFVKELGLSPEQRDKIPHHQPRVVSEADVRGIVREILEEDEKSILRRCSNICLEALCLLPREDTFDRIVDFLGRICDWLVSSGDFLTACSIVSDLNSLMNAEDIPEARKASIRDTLVKQAERRKLSQIGEHLQTLSDQRVDETFAYLALMPPAAVDPLCDILAECETRKIRYLLCRAISVIAKNEPDRLRRFVQDKRWFFVRNIVMILGMTANPEAIELIKPAVSHSEARVRREVARSVGKLRNPDGLDLLETLLQDDNKMVRLVSLSAVRDIGSDNAHRFLEPYITAKTFNSRSVDEKREVMRTYGSLGESGFEFLKSIIEGRCDHLDEETRASAVYGIAMTDASEAQDYLRVVLDRSQGPIRHATSEVLATFENQILFGEKT
jgi:hypothetical protein